MTYNLKCMRVSGSVRLLADTLPCPTIKLFVMANLAILARLGGLSYNCALEGLVEVSEAL